LVPAPKRGPYLIECPILRDILDHDKRDLLSQHLIDRLDDALPLLLGPHRYDDLEAEQVPLR
jgi:hypothetical protein